jgi:hypothetical protein
LPQCADAIAAVRQDFVRIGLVSDVPDQSVGRRIEHVMECHGQFDDAEAGAKMAAGHGDRIDCLPAQFVGNLP